MEVINQVRRPKFGTVSIDLKLGHITYITNKGSPYHKITAKLHCSLYISVNIWQVYGEASPFIPH